MSSTPGLAISSCRQLPPMPARADAAVSDPTGQTAGSGRVLRGGAFFGHAADCSFRVSLREPPDEPLLQQLFPGVLPPHLASVTCDSHSPFSSITHPRLDHPFSLY